MRNAFVEALTERAETDDSVVLLTGDLGFTVLEPFAERHPDRFFNVGVAEQNMVALATGLALRGFTPYVYSIATFASMRPYEFIRNGPVLHRLPVRVVGVGGGVDYGTNGPTHHALEDVALMRVQPGMAVFAPADRDQARSAMQAVFDLDGPAYVRLGKGGSPVAELEGRFRTGRLERIGSGTDVVLLTYGSITAEVVQAARLLGDRGIEATVAVAASLAPAPIADLVELLSDTPLAVTVESHYDTGGLGSLVSEVVAEHRLDCGVVRQGVRGVPGGVGGGPSWLLQRNGLSAPQVADIVLQTLQPQL